MLDFEVTTKMTSVLNWASLELVLRQNSSTPVEQRIYSRTSETDGQTLVTAVVRMF